MKKKLSPTAKKLIVTAIVVCVFMLVCAIIFWPYIQKLDDPATRKEVQKWLTSRGIGGWFILFGIMMILTVIPLFSAAPLELIAGAMYGTLGGTGLCLAGCAAGSLIVFFLTHKFGVSILDKFFGKGKMEQYDFVKNGKNIEKILFVVFLIPGLPKDIFIYLAGISRINVLRFLLVSCVARIPSLLITTMMGNSVTKGQWIVAVCMLVALIVIGIIAFKNKKKIMDYIHKLEGHNQTPKDGRIDSQQVQPADQKNGGTIS